MKGSQDWVSIFKQQASGERQHEIKHIRKLPSVRMPLNTYRSAISNFLDNSDM
jgi:hypothetical protein